MRETLRGYATPRRETFHSSTNERTKKMSKAYIVTAVDYGDSVDGKARTIGVFFDRDKAQKALNEDMNTYIGYFESQGQIVTETELAVWHDDNHGCEWNIEDKEVEIPLTPTQTTTLNEMAAQINDGMLSLEEADYLSAEETNYIKWVLETTYHYNTDTTKEDK